MPDRLPFHIYQRSLKSGKKIYYAKYLKPDGTYTAGRSTGQVTRKKAEIEAWKHIQTGTITEAENQTVQEFSKGFFDWDGQWSLSKRSAGRRLSREQCKRNNSVLENHVNRLLGQRYLSEIDTATVRHFRNTLYKEGYAGSTINKALGALRAILEYAEELHLLRGMPRIERAGLNQEERGILTPDEVKALFSLSWLDIRAYAANLIAASTGFRLSEILGIKFRNIEKDYINITGVWNWREQAYIDKLKNNQRSRRVPVPVSVQEAIEKLSDLHPFGPDPEHYILFSDHSPDYPVRDKFISNHFYKMLERLDPPITPAERERRNITFHSHRHFFNSLLVESRIPLQKIQQLTGHLSASMTQRYYHQSNLDDVAEIQRELFTIVKGA